MRAMVVMAALLNNMPPEERKKLEELGILKPRPEPKTQETK